MEKVLLADIGLLARRVLLLLDSTRQGLGQVAHGKPLATLIALRGDLGAGKTTFVQALAKELGVHGIIQSPTYVLMKRHNIPHHKYFIHLIHIDAYRLEGANEFAALRPEQFLEDPHALVCVEWPERIEGALPTPDITIQFSSDPPAGEAGNVGEKERYIDIRT